MNIIQIFSMFILSISLTISTIPTFINIVEAKEIKGELLGNYIATGYNLSVESCGKSKSHPNYGLTASGFDLSGLTREEAMTIATDKKKIPLGTKVYLEFEDDYKNLNGIYTSRDTGNAIKGNKIDVYMGEDISNKKIREKIGKQKIKVYEIIE